MQADKSDVYQRTFHEKQERLAAQVSHIFRQERSVIENISNLRANDHRNRQTYEISISLTSGH